MPQLCIISHYATLLLLWERNNSVPPQRTPFFWDWHNLVSRGRYSSFKQRNLIDLLNQCNMCEIHSIFFEILSSGSSGVYKSEFLFSLVFCQFLFWIKQILDYWSSNLWDCTLLEWGIRFKWFFILGFNIPLNVWKPIINGRYGLESPKNGLFRFKSFRGVWN